MGRIIPNPAWSEKRFEKESKRRCPLAIKDGRECICKQFAKSGKIGLCEGKRFFREPEV